MLIIYGLLQGAILGPFLFNIHPRNLIYSLENVDIVSYAYDNTLYSTKKNKETANNVIKTP